MSKLFRTSAIVREYEKLANGDDSKNVGIFDIVAKKNAKTYTTGGGNTTYREFHAKVGINKAKATFLWESTYDAEGNPLDFIKVTHGAVDPSKQDREEGEKKKKEAVISTTFENSADFGKFANIHDNQFALLVDERNSLESTDPNYIQSSRTTMNARGQPVVNTIRELSTGVKRFYSNKDTVPIEFRGKPRPDPKIEFTVDFEKWPKSFSNLAGKPKTYVYDFDRPILVDGVKTKPYRYELVKVFNDDEEEEMLDENNAWKFLTRGSRIHKIVIDKTSVSISDKYISNKNYVREIVISSNPDESGTVTIVGDDGENEEVEAYSPVVENVPNTTNEKPSEAANTPVDQVNTTLVNKDQIEALMGDIMK
jgi:hypothetical protein